MKMPTHSPSAIAKYPAPDRDNYFTGGDYALACMRVHERRLKFDKIHVAKQRIK